MKMLVILFMIIVDVLDQILLIYYVNEKVLTFDLGGYDIIIILLIVLIDLLFSYLVSILI